MCPLWLNKAVNVLKWDTDMWYLLIYSFICFFFHWTEFECPAMPEDKGEIRWSVCKSRPAARQWQRVLHNILPDYTRRKLRTSHDQCAYWRRLSEDLQPKCVLKDRKWLGTVRRGVCVVVVATGCLKQGLGWENGSRARKANCREAEGFETSRMDK